MYRFGMAVLVFVGMGLMVMVFTRAVEGIMTNRRTNYSDAERAAGVHCIDDSLNAPYPMKTALEARLDTRDLVSGIDIRLAPAEGGIHRMIVHYDIGRMGQVVETGKMARGQMKTADCTFTLATVER